MKNKVCLLKLDWFEYFFGNHKFEEVQKNQNVVIILKKQYQKSNITSSKKQIEDLFRGYTIEEYNDQNIVIKTAKNIFWN